MIKNLVSIVIPTFNGEKFIGECLQSIYDQADASYEIIVVDDLSTDSTVDIARKMGANVIVNSIHKGQVAGKNTGIMNMHGSYFLTIDQDDKLKPNALRSLIDELEKSDAEIVMSRLCDFAETNDDISYCHEEPFRGILTGAALFKREVFDKIGLFEESIITGEVIDLVDRCDRNKINILYSDIVTCDRRIHASNFGRTNAKDEYRDYAKILRRQFLERINK